MVVAFLVLVVYVFFSVLHFTFRLLWFRFRWFPSYMERKMNDIVIKDERNGVSSMQCAVHAVHQLLSFSYFSFTYMCVCVCIHTCTHHNPYKPGIEAHALLLAGYFEIPVFASSYAVWFCLSCSCAFVCSCSCSHSVAYYATRWALIQM